MAGESGEGVFIKVQGLKSATKGALVSPQGTEANPDVIAVRGRGNVPIKKEGVFKPTSQQVVELSK